MPNFETVALIERTYYPFQVFCWSVEKNHARCDVIRDLTVGRFAICCLTVNFLLQITKDWPVCSSLKKVTEVFLDFSIVLALYIMGQNKANKGFQFFRDLLRKENGPLNLVKTLKHLSNSLCSFMAYEASVLRFSSGQEMEWYLICFCVCIPVCVI